MLQNKLHELNFFGIITTQSQALKILSCCWQGQAQQLIFHKWKTFWITITAAGKAKCYKHYDAADKAKRNK